MRKLGSMSGVDEGRDRYDGSRENRSLSSDRYLLSLSVKRTCVHFDPNRTVVSLCLAGILLRVISVGGGGGRWVVSS